MTIHTPITIAIPYHKNLAYLQATLKSIEQQTVLPVETIIIDNSIDGDAITIVEAISINIRYIRAIPNLGLAAYFNQCLDASTTPWCTIVHSDDLLLPNYIEVMSESISRNVNAAGIFTKTQAINQDGHKCSSLKDWGKQYFWPAGDSEVIVHGEQALATVLRVNYIMCPTICYNLKVLANRRFDPIWKLSLDLEFHGRLLLDGEQLIGINKALYACRRHPEATTSLHQRDFSMFIEGRDCIDSLAHKATEQGWTNAWSAGRKKIIYHLFVIYNVLIGLRFNNMRTSIVFLFNYLLKSRA